MSLVSGANKPECASFFTCKKLLLYAAVLVADLTYKAGFEMVSKLYLHDYSKVLQYCRSHLKFNY